MQSSFTFFHKMVLSQTLTINQKQIHLVAFISNKVKLGFIFEPFGRYTNLNVAIHKQALNKL